MAGDDDDDSNTVFGAHPSISLRMIRHAESRNNQVYCDARGLFAIGTDKCDVDGWQSYIDTHRRADCDISDRGQQQAQNLADSYLGPLIEERNQNVRVIVSPMRRTLATLRPTLERCRLNAENVLVHAEYFETEGCHTKGVAEEGMNPHEIRQFLDYNNNDEDDDAIMLQFHGFAALDRGWWQQQGHETRAQAERRAARFYLWLCEHLDAQLLEQKDGRPAAKRSLPPLHILIGHGDFTNLLLQRIMGSFGHAVEIPGLPHRGAMVHWNTGVTELEYFGAGRWLILCHNRSSHIPSDLLTGGSLDDGWSYLMPQYKEYTYNVMVCAELDDLPGHVHEQRDALLSLYRHSSSTTASSPSSSTMTTPRQQHYAVCHHNQVLAVATCEGHTVVDLAMRPSATLTAIEKLLGAIVEGKDDDDDDDDDASSAVVVQPANPTSKETLVSVGFSLANDQSEQDLLVWRKHSAGAASLSSKI